MRRILRGYQKEAFRYALKMNHFALFVEMRLGKTLVVTRVCRQKQKQLNSILVVGPFETYSGWRKEVSLEFDEDILLLSGTKQKRQKLLFDNFPLQRWFFLNKEGYRAIPEIKDYPWDALFLDESSFIKNNVSVTKFFLKNFRDVPLKGILTGTPAVNSELDYYNQLQFLNPNMLEEQSYWQFRNKRFRRRGFNWTITAEGKKYLAQSIAKHCYVMTRKEAGIGPEKIYETRDVYMSSKLRKVYEVLLNEFILETEETFEMTKYATTRFILLRKFLNGICHGQIYWDGKSQALRNLAETELKGEQLLIWCSYREDIDMLYTKFKKDYRIGIVHKDVSHKNRIKIIQDFQNKKLDWIVATPCIKYGTDLSNASAAIFFSVVFGEARIQLEDRCIDVSKNDPKLIIDLIVHDTIEEDLYKEMLRRKSEQKSMYKLIRKWRKKYAKET